MEELLLKKNENGETVQVITTIQTQEVPFNTDEIKRQIAEHAAIVDGLQRQLNAVQEFEAQGELEAVVQVKELESPLIGKEELADLVAATTKEDTALADGAAKEWAAL